MTYADGARTKVKIAGEMNIGQQWDALAGLKTQAQRFQLLAKAKLLNKFTRQSQVGRQNLIGGGTESDG